MVVATTAPAQLHEQKFNQVQNQADLNDNDDQYEIPLANLNDANNESEENTEDEDLELEEAEQIKCSAVHTLERDMPDFDYSKLVEELRDRILQECEQNPGIYSQKDKVKCKTDDWFLSRFLLRHKLDIDLAFEMLKNTMRFKHESLTNSIRREDFPAEFYKVGGVFGYEPDRKGNKMLYIRVKVHRKIPEIQSILQAFLYYNIEQIDEEANGKGRWIEQVQPLETSLPCP